MRSALEQARAREAHRSLADEIKRTIQILSRRTKNNPLLVGPGALFELPRVAELMRRAAGVGKTAIIEGMAQRIVAGEVPESLKGRRRAPFLPFSSGRLIPNGHIRTAVLALDLSSLISGTGVRGSFEEKIRNLLQDIEEEKGKIIVFIGLSPLAFPPAMRI